MGNVGADGMYGIADVDEATVGCEVIGLRRLLLVEVANVEAILGGGLPVDAAEVFLIGVIDLLGAAEGSEGNVGSRDAVGCDVA